MGNNNLIQRMITLGEEKLKELKQLWDITEEQAKNCTEDQISQFVILLDQRQEHFDRILEIDKAFEETSKILKKNLKVKYLNQINQYEYPLVKDLLKISDEIVNMAKRIKSLDDENKKRIEALFEAIKVELKKIGEGKAANKLYQGGYLGSGGTFFDTKR
ncbi:MAG TPA: flagellar export chaperone FlgN [Defluviitaleaceae bacterium]|nr:flagellar export chaperone FlgN [Defluviitaleaceae bacterium]